MFHQLNHSGSQLIKCVPSEISIYETEEANNAVVCCKNSVNCEHVAVASCNDHETLDALHANVGEMSYEEESTYAISEQGDLPRVRRSTTDDYGHKQKSIPVLSESFDAIVANGENFWNSRMLLLPASTAITADLRSTALASSSVSDSTHFPTDEHVRRKLHYRPEGTSTSTTHKLLNHDSSGDMNYRIKPLHHSKSGKQDDREIRFDCIEMHASKYEELAEDCGDLNSKEQITWLVKSNVGEPKLKNFVHNLPLKTSESGLFMREDDNLLCQKPVNYKLFAGCKSEAKDITTRGHRRILRDQSFSSNVIDDCLQLCTVDERRKSLSFGPRCVSDRGQTNVLRSDSLGNVNLSRYFNTKSSSVPFEGSSAAGECNLNISAAHCDNSKNAVGTGCMRTTQGSSQHDVRMSAMLPSRKPEIACVMPLIRHAADGNKTSVTRRGRASEARGSTASAPSNREINADISNERQVIEGNTTQCESANGAVDIRERLPFCEIDRMYRENQRTILSQDCFSVKNHQAKLISVPIREQKSSIRKTKDVSCAEERTSLSGGFKNSWSTSRKLKHSSSNGKDIIQSHVIYF